MLILFLPMGILIPFCRHHGSTKVKYVKCFSSHAAPSKSVPDFDTCDLIGFLQWFILDISPMYPNVSPTICKKHNRSLLGSETAISFPTNCASYPITSLVGFRWWPSPGISDVFRLPAFFSGSQKALIEGCMLYLSMWYLNDIQLYCRFCHSPVSFDFPGDSGFSFSFFKIISATLLPLKLIWGEASYSIAFFGLGVTLTSRRWGNTVHRNFEGPNDTLRGVVCACMAKPALYARPLWWRDRF